jgi:hypothetical protein
MFWTEQSCFLIYLGMTHPEQLGFGNLRKVRPIPVFAAAPRPQAFTADAESELNRLQAIRREMRSAVYQRPGVAPPAFGQQWWFTYPASRPPCTQDHPDVDTRDEHDDEIHCAILRSTEAFVAELKYACAAFEESGGGVDVAESEARQRGSIDNRADAWE